MKILHRIIGRGLHRLPDVLSHLRGSPVCRQSPERTTLTQAGDDSPCFATENIIMTIKEAQAAVDEWIKTYGVRYFNELTNMALLTEEVGELARIIARTYGEQSFKESDKNRNLGDEMADILWVLLCLANQTGVDLTEAFAKNMEKKTSRDRERHWNNEKLMA